MVGKGKDKSKPKKDEIDFNNKRIDLKRFAYDVIKYTALKFKVPENFITVWAGSDNDYGYDDFLLVLCSEIIRYQITNRYQYHTTFRQLYKSNKLASSKLIGILLQEVIRKTTEKPSLTPLHTVEISLSIVCELFLFLYSKDMDLNPRQLATTWFQCYLNINKKQFENSGGLEEMYFRGRRSKVDGMDAFVNKFIEDHCLPYKTTANNRDLKKMYCQSVHERNQKAAESLSPKDCEEMKKMIKRVKRIGKHPAMRFNSKNGGSVVVQSSQPDETSRVKLARNPRLGIIPHNEVMLHFFGPSILSSQEPPASTTEEQPQNKRSLSYKERMKMKKSNLRANVEKDLRRLSLDSSKMQRSSAKTLNVSEAKDAIQSYNLQGAISKTQMENRGSSAWQACISSLCSSKEQGPGQWVADFNLLGFESEVKNGGSSATQAGKSSSCSSKEQGPGQWVADFNLLGAESEVKNGGSSASQAGKSSSCSSKEQGPGQWISDFSFLGAESEVKNGGSSSQAGKSSLCSSKEQGPGQWVADFNLPGVKSEMENGRSCASKTGKSSLGSSKEQGPGQWIADFNLLGAKSETEVENGGSWASQAGESSLCSREEQSPAPFSLDFNLLEDKSEIEVENERSLDTSNTIYSSNGKQGLGQLS